MKQSPFILLLNLVLVFSAKAQQDKQEILSNYENKMAKLNSWEYDIHYEIKRLSSDDTLNFYANCKLIKHTTDTLFGGSFWIKTDSIDRYYDLENIYIIEHNKKKITRYFPHKGQTWAINGSTIRDVLNSYFLKPNRFTKYLSDSTTSITLSKTISDSQTFSVIEFGFKDELPVEKQKKTFYFDENNTLKKITFSVKFQNNWQYNEWHFSNEKYNEIRDEQLKSEFNRLAENYTMEDYKEPDPIESEPLANGTIAPTFAGLNFQTNDSVNLSDFKNKIVLIDFWYKDCYPCMKAIPFLSRLKTKYGEDKLVVLGLNAFDSNEEKKKKVQEFIEINKMNYPAIFIDRLVLESYNVKVFPTFYIIDKEGKIVYSKIGFREENEEVIDRLLEEMME